MIRIGEGYELQIGRKVKVFAHVFDKHSAMCREYVVGPDGGYANNDPCPEMITTAEVARFLGRAPNEVEFITK
ncbi:MAG: hypothetical protein II332_06830 [Kiritimatiellae bacterium]|nr:hypothetical protein [Kiritimatiellia bacterium]